MKNKGFTLIELLIVIAIIGILSSVVLASLNSARGKGANAAVKSGLASLRNQAEIYYDDNFQSYNGVCTSTKFIAMLTNASTTGGGVYGCANDINSWAAYAKLKVAESLKGYWCVNSDGLSKATTSVPGTWATSSCQ